MKFRIPVLASLAVFALSACDKPAPPAQPAEELEPLAADVPAVSAPALTPQPTLVPPPPVNDPGYVATPAPAPPPEFGGVTPQESFATKAATAAIPAEAIGGSPVTNDTDAWFRGDAALRKFCEDQKLPFSNFGTKEKPVKTGGYWTMQYFGAVNGQGMYVGIRVYPDGRAEIIL